MDGPSIFKQAPGTETEAQAERRKQEALARLAAYTHAVDQAYSRAVTVALETVPRPAAPSEKKGEFSSRLPEAPAVTSIPLQLPTDMSGLTSVQVSIVHAKALEKTAAALNSASGGALAVFGINAHPDGQSLLVGPNPNYDATSRVIQTPVPPGVYPFKLSEDASIPPTLTLDVGALPANQQKSYVNAVGTLSDALKNGQLQPGQTVLLEVTRDGQFHAVLDSDPPLAGQPAEALAARNDGLRWGMLNIRHDIDRHADLKEGPDHQPRIDDTDTAVQLTTATRDAMGGAITPEAVAKKFVNDNLNDLIALGVIIENKEGGKYHFTLAKPIECWVPVENSARVDANEKYAKDLAAALGNELAAHGVNTEVADTKDGKTVDMVVAKVYNIWSLSSKMEKGLKDPQEQKRKSDEIMANRSDFIERYRKAAQGMKADDLRDELCKLAADSNMMRKELDGKTKDGMLGYLGDNIWKFNFDSKKRAGTTLEKDVLAPMRNFTTHPPILVDYEAMSDGSTMLYVTASSMFKPQDIMARGEFHVELNQVARSPSQIELDVHQQEDGQGTAYVVNGPDGRPIVKNAFDAVLVGTTDNRNGSTTTQYRLDKFCDASLKLRFKGNEYEINHYKRLMVPKAMELVLDPKKPLTGKAYADRVADVFKNPAFMQKIAQLKEKHHLDAAPNPVLLVDLVAVHGVNPPVSLSSILESDSYNRVMSAIGMSGGVLDAQGRADPKLLETAMTKIGQKLAESPRARGQTAFREDVATLLNSGYGSAALDNLKPAEYAPAFGNLMLSVQNIEDYRADVGKLVAAAKTIPLEARGDPVVIKRALDTVEASSAAEEMMGAAIKSIHDAVALRP